MCLNEREQEVTLDPANLQLLECNSMNNQMWTEKATFANPTSDVKTLVSSRSPKCITYQPGDYTDHAKVWLTSCGKEGQGWIRPWDSTVGAWLFEAADAPGMCMSATEGTVVGGFIGIELRSCGISSSHKAWRYY
jgi:hypothetical protein